MKKRVQSVRVRLRAQPSEYEIKIGAGTLGLLGREARRSISKHARRIVIVSNPRVFELYGEQARASLRASHFQVELLLIGDGERHKSLRTLEAALNLFHSAGLERSDAVVALGGGVVGDLAGFAAATYLRGIDLMQVPTTLLAQIDASVGGKTAVNTPWSKNSIGAFHQPRVVLIDTETLRTLPARELTAGWCEAVKQGAVGSRQLFLMTYDFLSRHAFDGEGLKSASQSGQKRRASRLDQLIAAQCAFKASIVAGDERESLARTDASSRRILNFGHTTAHALETVTRYRRFRHGEAVGYGMLVAGEISKGLGLLDISELEYLRAAVRLTGRLPRTGDLDTDAVTGALAHDKKSVGGQIKWVLLKALGRAVLVDGREIPRTLLRDSLRAVLQTTPQ
ncbi:MAG TPA: 3-dehydroquinate synthase [Pyrinomonadaceae bacterium]|nr:3-dehydroquinate synthase [Pyrinomonadaceae bacterium]